MYRIVCESYENYMNDFLPNNTDNFRYKIMKPFRLITDMSIYENEKKLESDDFKKLEDFIYHARQEINNYPNIKSFLWSLESRGIHGQNFGILSVEELTEMMKIINMFLKLSYWN